MDAVTPGGTPAGAIAGDGLKALRATVEAVVAALGSPDPETLDGTAKVLQAVTERLVEVREQLRASGVGPENFEELRAIRLGARRAGALLEKARQFHSAWEAYIAARVGGYRAGGQPAPLLRPGRFSLEA